jgi:hypothetical protein
MFTPFCLTNFIAMKPIKKTYYTIIIFTLLLGTQSCKDKTKQSAEQEKKGIRAGNANVSEPATDRYVQKIDRLPLENMPYLSSLNYSNDDHELSVKAYLQDSSIVKIIERYVDKKKQIIGHHIFYMKDGNLIFARQIQQEPLPDSSSFMHEIVSYYKAGKPTKSAERKTNFEEDLSNTPLEACAIKDMKFDEINTIFNQEGPYETNFLGFIEAGSFKFLWIGKDDKKGLTSALLIEVEDPFMSDLIKNEKKYLGKRLEVNYELSNIQGINYQVYRGGHFAE